MMCTIPSFRILKFRRIFNCRFFVLAAVLVLGLMSTSDVQGQCTRCCFPYPNVSVSPTTAEEGQPVALTTTVLNCSYGRVFTIKVNVTPNDISCSSFAEAFSASVYVPPFQSRTLTYTFPAPKCDSTYKVSAGSAAGIATTTLTVN
jgi:hypothetical protein